MGRSLLKFRSVHAVCRLYFINGLHFSSPSEQATLVSLTLPISAVYSLEGFCPQRLLGSLLGQLSGHGETYFLENSQNIFLDKNHQLLHFIQNRLLMKESIPALAVFFALLDFHVANLKRCVFGHPLGWSTCEQQYKHQDLQVRQVTKTEIWGNELG